MTYLSHLNLRIEAVKFAGMTSSTKKVSIILKQLTLGKVAIAVICRDL